MLQDTELKQKIARFFKPSLTVDKLLREKVTELFLLDEVPTLIRIGDKAIYVGNLTLENQYAFFKAYRNILLLLDSETIDFNLLADADRFYQALMLNRRVFLAFCDLLAATVLKQQRYYFTEGDEHIKLKLKRCSVRYFRERVTVEKVLQIGQLLYLYNIDALRQNIRLLADKMQVSQVAESTMYTWLKNMRGISGRFMLAELKTADKIPVPTATVDTPQPQPTNRKQQMPLSSIPLRD